MARTIGLIIALAFATTSALAQQPPDPMEACYRQADGAARLACFNNEMQRRHAAAATPRKQPEEAAARQQRAADNIGLEGKALHQKLKEEGVTIAPVKPIVATVTRLLRRPQNEYAFELDNGQTWEQAESKADLYVNPHDSVTIKPGVLGSFYMTIDNQRIRVHRIR